MKALYIVSGLRTEASGIGRIACDLASALGQVEEPVSLYATDSTLKDQNLAAHMVTPPTELVVEPGQWMGRLAYSPALRRRLKRDMAKADVVHNHSMWMLPNHYASQAAFEQDVPVVFTAHGYLDEWALSHSRWKKWLVGKWFQDRDLARAACIHVNSTDEISSIRSYGLDNPIAVVPNGVDLVPFEKNTDITPFLERYPELRNKRLALFLSRIHKKKGLSHLVQAWARLIHSNEDWHLVIAGPDDGQQDEIETLVAELGIGNHVTFPGMLTGSEKYAAYQAADCFVLPSFSEGFSMAVLEAMAAKLPVVITPACNFPEVDSTGAGVIATPDEASTYTGLAQIMSLSDSAREDMGSRGRQLVERKYTWQRVAEQMVELYRWVMGGSSAPAFVQC